MHYSLMEIMRLSFMDNDFMAGRRGHMVAGFTATRAINAYHH
jgi:hypothetical protein